MEPPVLAGTLDDERPWSTGLGAHLEAARQRAGLRRVDLAARVGVSEETIRLWERGAVQPSPERLARVIPILAIEASAWQAAAAAEDTAEDLPELARRLRQERAALGLTQAAVARRIGVAPATYAGWETGRTNPAAVHAPVVAELLRLGEDEAARLIGAPWVVDHADWPSFGQILGARRQALRLTRGALAEQVGTTARTIMSWELGYRRPPARQVAALAEVLEVEVTTLLAALPHRSAPTRLGELILARQQVLGLHSTDVARLVGTTEPTVSRWINGHSRPVGKNLERLAAALRVPLTQLTDVAGAPA